MHTSTRLCHLPSFLISHFSSLKHKTFIDKLKKAKNIIKEFRDHKANEREKDLALKRKIFGQSLPDIRTWEEYHLDEENLKKFHEQLDIMENATEQEIEFLENRPGNSQFTFLLFYKFVPFF